MANAKVPKAVALSSIGADRDRDTGWIAMNRMLEQRLRSTERSVAFLRAAYFIENWTPLILQAMHSRALSTFLSPAHRRLPMIAAADVGRVAAELLQEDWGGQRIVDLAGPQPYSPADVAARLGELIERPVAVDPIAEDAWPTALAAAGYSGVGMRGFIDMTRSLNNGHISFPKTAQARRGKMDLSSALRAIVAGLKPPLPASRRRNYRGVAGVLDVTPPA